MARNVLLLSTYPVRVPRHGGQIRVAQIQKAYQAAGWEARVLSVYEPDVFGRQAVERWDVPFPWDDPHRFIQGQRVPQLVDLLSGKFLAGSPGVLKAAVDRLSIAPQVIQCEQPYLWPVAAELRARYLPEARIVYSAHNVEFLLKGDILRLAGLPLDLCDSVTTEIEGLERVAARGADLVLAVTEADAAVLKEFGARKVVVAPNGVREGSVTPARVSHWRRMLPNAPWLFYVASAHLPNYSGFRPMLGGSLGSIPPDSKLVVAGAVGERIAADLATGAFATLNTLRLQLTGVLDEQDLDAVKSLATGYVLPIISGSGSNLKTAEAIFSGKWVVATSVALRGYERYIGSPGIVAADDPPSFHRAIRTVLRASGEHGPLRPAAGELLWTSTLGEIVGSIEALP